MGLRGVCNAGWAKHSSVRGERVEIDAPFLRTTSWRVPPLYEAWVENVAVNHSTSESDRFRFFRLPEARIFVAVLVGPGRAEFVVSGATLKLHAMPPFPDCEVIGPIVLRPGAAQSLLGMPSSEIANQIIDADAIWGNWAREVERFSAR